VPDISNKNTTIGQSASKISAAKPHLCSRKNELKWDEEQAKATVTVTVIRNLLNER